MTGYADREITVELLQRVVKAGDRDSARWLLDDLCTRTEASLEDPSQECSLVEVALDHTPCPPALVVDLMRVADLAWDLASADDHPPDDALLLFAAGRLPYHRFALSVVAHLVLCGSGTCREVVLGSGLAAAAHELAAFDARLIEGEISEADQPDVAAADAASIADLLSWRCEPYRQPVQSHGLGDSGASAWLPPLLHVVPRAWQQDLKIEGETRRVEVWLARLDTSLLVRIGPGELASSSSFDLMRTAPRPELRLALRPAGTDVLDFLALPLPEVVSGGTWFQVGEPSPSAFAALDPLEGGTWVLEPFAPSSRVESAAGSADATSADQICFEAVREAADGRWKPFLYELRRVRNPPAEFLRIEARFYLHCFLATPQLEQERSGFLTDELGKELLALSWLGADLLDRLPRPGAGR
jgi:hypothetical protein